MDKDVNKFLDEMIKYDLYGGIILSLILSMVVDVKFSVIYLIGIIVALVNFFVSGKIIKKRLGNKSSGGMLFQSSYLIRILVVVGLALPFTSQLINLIAYVLGYISHFVFLTIYWIKSQKGSD